MSRLAPNLHRLLFPFLLVLALSLTGCTDNARVTSANEVDEPGYREGQALLKTGRKQEALASFLKVIGKLRDDAPESHLEVGMLYLQHINDPLSAIYHFKKYLALRPNGPLSPLVKQRIDAATREFARTLPAQALEGQVQRVDLVATLDRLKQENDALKQELADLKAGRTNSSGSTEQSLASSSVAPTSDTESSGPLTFSFDTVPTVRTRPAVSPAARPTVPATGPASTPQIQAPASAPAPGATAPANRPAAGRRHVVRPGDSLMKISMQYYGNRSKWREIYAANRQIMRSETDLKVGMALQIP